MHLDIGHLLGLMQGICTLKMADGFELDVCCSKGSYEMNGLCKLCGIKQMLNNNYYRGLCHIIKPYWSSDTRHLDIPAGHGCYYLRCPLSNKRSERSTAEDRNDSGKKTKHTDAYSNGNDVKVTNNKLMSFVSPNAFGNPSLPRGGNRKKTKPKKPKPSG